MEWGRMGLRGIVALTSAVLILVFAAIVGLVTGARSERQLQEEVGRSLTESSFQMAERLDTDMWARSNQVSVLARISAMRDWAVAQTVVDGLKATDHTLAWVGVADRTGRVMASSGGVLLGADLSKRPVFLNGLQGHFVGDVHDAVLRQVSARLAASLRGGDVVARLGGDEFVIILNSHGAGETLPPLDAITARLIAAVNEPLVIQGQAVRVGCSIGVAVGPAGADATVQAVLDHADSALYAAKRAWRNRAVFHGAANDSASAPPLVLGEA